MHVIRCVVCLAVGTSSITTIAHRTEQTEKKDNEMRAIPLKFYLNIMQGF